MQSRNRIRTLQAMPFFGGTTDNTIEFLLERCSTRHASRGDYFFREGDSADSMFILEEGAADLMKQLDGHDYPLRRFSQGDCFGEVAMMDLLPRSASVRAGKDCTAIEIPRLALYELSREDLEQFTIIQMNMGREVCRRLRQADTRLFEARHDHSTLTGDHPFHA